MFKMKILFIILLASSAFSSYSDIQNSSEVRQTLKTLVKNFKKTSNNALSSYTYSAEYQKPVHNFRFTGTIFSDAFLLSGYKGAVARYGFHSDDLKELIDLITNSGYSSSPYGGNSLGLKDNESMLFSFSWTYLLKVKVSGEDVVVLLIAKGEANILKEICEVTSSNLKSCYIINNLDTDIVDMLEAYIFNQLSNKINTNEEE